MRWKILALLFFARMSMAFQFGAVGAVGPLYVSTFGVTTADLGFLIGLYFLPGIIVAVPGGSLGARFGDKRVTVLGLAMMAAGSLAMAVSDDWSVQLLGRVLAGSGGVFLNVLMTKMVADWFAGRELATAMGVFLNSWPAGIALSLLLVPALAEVTGLSGATWIIAAVIGGFAVLVARAYRSPTSAGPAQPGRGVAPRGFGLAGVILAGGAWGLFNAAFSMVFSFGPSNLVERGWPLVEASSVISLVVWVVMLAGAAGGALADWTGRPLLILVGCAILMAPGLLFFPYAGAVWVYALLLGSVIGLPVGIYVSFGAAFLQPAERAVGMGIFFMVYYLIFAAAPGLAGILIDTYAETALAFRFGAGLMGLTLVCLVACIWLKQRLDRTG